MIIVMTLKRKSMKHFNITSIYFVLAVFVTATLFTACQKDELDNTVTLTAIADDAANGGKAYVYNNYMCWHNTDIVKVNDVNCTTVVSTSGGESTATASIPGVAYNENGYVAAYPASSVKSMESGKNGKVTISVPVTQTYTTLTTAAGTTAQVVPMPMVGRCASADEPLKFHNAAALVKVAVSGGEGMQVYKIVVSTTDGVLSGSAEMSAGDEEENKVLVPTIGTGNSVTLDCSGSLPGLGDFYLVVAPFEDQAVTVTVWAKDASSQKYAITKTSQHQGGLTIGRNQIGPIPITIGADADKVNFWGSGNSTDPYLITDKKDLETFRSVTNAGTSGYCGNTVYYKQTANIENYGSYSNTNATPFTGHYDGGGHSITFNLSTTGLVKTLGNGAEIKNLTLKGGQVSNNVDKWGAFSCSIADGAKVTLKNCTNEISFTNNSSTYLGGLIGYASNSSIELTLENCSNKAIISGKNYVGGVLGYAPVKKIKMTRCSNEGAVTCAASSSACVGGLVSYAYLQGYYIIDLNSCVNSGEVKMDGAKAATLGACGGIIGYLKEANSSNAVTITNCANKADVSAGGNIHCMGGIVGMFHSTSANGNCCVYNCYSTGNLWSSGTGTNMGGIMAIYNSSKQCTIEIKNCYFSGSFLETSMTNYSGIASKSNITCDSCYSVNNCTGVGTAEGISITPITNAGTLLDSLNNNRGSWSEWKAGATYPVFKWE